MSDSIINGFSEMKDIYLTQILTEGKDYDGDGKVEDPKNNAIRKALGKPPEDDYEPEDEEDDEDEEDKDEKPKSKRKHKKDEEKDDEMKTESFSNWRSDLYEVISKLEPKVKEIDNDEPISEKKVVNKVVLNPVVTEKFTLIGEQELDEEFLLETASVASEYFANLGLNEHGLEMVIDYLGEEKFLEYVFYVTGDLILNESVENLKISVGRRIKIDEGNRLVEAASQQQPKGKPFKDRLARAIMQTADDLKARAERDIARRKEIMQAAEPIVKTARKAVGVAAQGAGHFATGVLHGIPAGVGLANVKTGEDTPLSKKLKGSGDKKPTPQKSFGSKKSREQKEKNAAAIEQARRDMEAREAKNAARRKKAAEKRAAERQSANESVHYIMEKAVSEQQQKIFGLALAVKRGEVSRSKVSEKVLEIADSMSEAEIRKFASTKHKGIPHRK